MTHGGKSPGPDISTGVSRRTLIQIGAGTLGSALVPGGLILPALAEDHPALGTYPAGSSGSSVFLGI